MPSTRYVINKLLKLIDESLLCIRKELNDQMLYYRFLLYKVIEWVMTILVFFYKNDKWTIGQHHWIRWIKNFKLIGKGFLREISSQAQYARKTSIHLRGNA